MTYVGRKEYDIHMPESTRDDAALIARDPSEVVKLCWSLENEVRLLRDSVPDGKRNHKRPDLIPERHYAIALADLESARLRILEAARVEDKIGRSNGNGP